MSSLHDLAALLADPFLLYLLQTHPNNFALTPTDDIPPTIHYSRVLAAYLADDAPNHELDAHPKIDLLRHNQSDLPPHIAHLIANVRRLQLPRDPVHIPIPPPPSPTLPPPPIHTDADGGKPKQTQTQKQKKMKTTQAHHHPRLSTQGMSPKKAHEVARMAAYILALVHANSLPTTPPSHARPHPRLHIVDVGAGQGYLTRALHALLPHARILALDADGAQSAGAVRWEERLFGKDAKEGDGSGRAGAGGIVHRTVLIGAEGDTEELGLRRVVSEWVREGRAGEDEDEDELEHEPAPVLFVALHACGSLTPALLRAFIASSMPRSELPATPHAAHNARDPDDEEHTLWRPAGVVAVGCCYNLMNPADFPLSATLSALRGRPLTGSDPECVDDKCDCIKSSNSQSLIHHAPALPPAAFHLAAQIPGTWETMRPGVEGEAQRDAREYGDVHVHLDSGGDVDVQVTPAVALAIRKVAWRALLERALLRARPAPHAEAAAAPALANEEETSANQVKTATAKGTAMDGDAGEPRIENEKRGKKDKKKDKKDSLRAKKASATVPARWQRRPENWAVSASTSVSEPAAEIADATRPIDATSPSTPQIQFTSLPPPPSLSPTPTPAPITNSSPVGAADGHPEDHVAPASGMGATPALRRLGRLRDGVYTASWGAFLREAGARMGVVFDARRGADGGDDDDRQDVEDNDADVDDEERTRLQTQLETLHVLRCVVGPAIESAILRDRQEWVREALAAGPRGDGDGDGNGNGDTGLAVELVNLFDQTTGSGRNVALVVAPRVPCASSA